MAGAYSIDVFSTLFDVLWLEGWLIPTRAVSRVEVRGPGIAGGRHVMASYGRIASPDVAAVHGRAGAAARFREQVAVVAAELQPGSVHLALVYSDGTEEGIGELAGAASEAADRLRARFTGMLADMTPGVLLEVGSRARSRIVRRDLVPAGWDYLGLDVMAGPNVDVVGDAHEISTLFPAGSFSAVMSFSVLEHLLMPWKFVAELNRVLVPGAVGLFTTHQCWPLHDEPWDFWRFSDRAWAGLLNAGTGFEIIEASVGEPAFVVSQRVHAATNFGQSQFGQLASNVLFRKVGETSLRWDVKLGDVVESVYPPGNL